MLKYQSSVQLDALVAQLQKKIAVDKIYLLGVTAADLPVNSIFHPYDHEEAPATGYFLLVLTRASEQRSGDTVQDILEQTRFPQHVHAMVYPERLFRQWLDEGQSFAVKVAEQAPLLANATLTIVRAPLYYTDSDWQNRRSQLIELGYHRSSSFLAGAKIFVRRKEYSLATFLLHQATEHACIAFILQFTGLKTSTHNLDKLLRYTMLISNEVIEHFPRRSRQDRELFRLLQKAYIHSRYKDDFIVTAEQADMLLRRISRMLECLLPSKDAGTVSEDEVMYCADIFCIEQWVQQFRSNCYEWPPLETEAVLF